MFTYDHEPINTVQLDKLGTIEDIKLPHLEIRNIEKLDQVFLFLKENHSSYNDIYEFCKAKWGDNKLLYLCFAEYLKVNSFTFVQNHSNGIRYSWKQKIAERGLALDGFTSEYNRQRKAKMSALALQQPTKPKTNRSHTLAVSLRNFFLSILG